MNMHSLPSALPGPGASLGAGSPTPRGCWACEPGQRAWGLCWSTTQPYWGCIGGLLS